MYIFEIIDMTFAKVCFIVTSRYTNE